MKPKSYILLLLAMLIGVAGAEAQNSNRLIIPDLTALAGSTIALPISMDNSSEIVAVEFDLQLPEGSTLDVDTKHLSNRAVDHEIRFKAKGGNTYHCLIYSPTNSALLGRAGQLMTVNMHISETYEEGSEHRIELSDVVLALRDGSNGFTDVQTGTLTMQKGPDLSVTNIMADATVYMPGTKAIVTWQVNNIGALATSAGWTEYLSIKNAAGVTKLLSTTQYDETLAANAVVSRQLEIVLPTILGMDGEVQLELEVQLYSGAGESQGLRWNNTGTTEVQIDKLLTLSLPTGAIDETYSRPIKCSLTRSGDRTTAETFNITATEDSRLSIPASITIPAGQSTVIFYIQLTDNTLLDDNSIINVTFSGCNYPEVSGQIEIEDNEYPDLTITSSKFNVSEGETFQLSVSAGRAPQENLTVSIVSEASGRFTFPAKVTIPAGTTSVTFDVTAVDDDIPSLTLSNTFTAYAPAYNKGEAIIILEDDDVPVLELTLTPNKVSEADGPIAVAATLRRTGVTNNKITVKLSDDSKGGIYYGTRTIELAKGVEEAHFNLGPIDNADVDGDRVVNITAAVYISSCSCNASGESAGVVAAQMTILDNDGPALKLTSAISTLKEGDSTTLTISRNTTDTSSPLTVTLSSDQDSRLTYDKNVTIPVGQSSVTVNVSSLANDIQGDSFTAVFTAQSDGFSSGTCFMMATDQTLPDARVNNITADKTETEVNTTATLTIEVANVGAATLPEGIAIRLYQRGVSGAIATLYTPSALGIGESLNMTSEISLPAYIGSHSFYAVINEANKVEELSFVNNTSPEVVIHTVSPFSAQVSTDKTIYQSGEIVSINGRIVGTGSANTTVELYIINEGSRQRVGVTTDAQGAFTYKWQLYALQSGHFVVGACYPDEGSWTEMAAFDVYGIRRTSYDNITCKPLVGESYNGSIQLYNPGQLELNNIHVEILSKPNDIEANFSSIVKMEGRSTQNITFTLNSNILSPVGAWEEVKIRVLTDEGPTEDITIYYHNSTPQAVLTPNVRQINTTMLVGESSEYTFYITNTGQGETGIITLDLPSWMKTLTASTISSLGYGQQTKVVLELTPTEEMQVNVPRTGNIGINCENGNGTSISYSIKPVSNRNGIIVVDVTDEYTFLTDEKPHIKGAYVEVRQPVTNELVSSGETDADGLFTLEVPSGYYKVSVTADKHDSYANNIEVAPSAETPVDVFLSFKAITYSLEVVETEVEDVYEVVTTVNYETRVPKPVVVVDFPQELPYKSQVFNIAITNKGLVSAFNVWVDLPKNREDATFETLIPLPIDTLKPQMSMFIPIRMTVTSDNEYNSQSSYDTGGTYYGDETLNSETSSKKIKRRDSVSFDDAEEISPGCWLLTFTVAHDRRECNKKTGKWETVGTDYSQRSYKYGNCGQGGSPEPIWFPTLPDWIPTYNPTPIGPTPPVDPPKERTYLKELITKLQEITQVFDGCTTDCEDAAAKAAAGCGFGAIGCIPTPVTWGIGCLGGLAVGCFTGIHTMRDAGECALSGLGCIPVIGCLASTAGCAMAVEDELNACFPNEALTRHKAKNRVMKKISKENHYGISLVAKAIRIIYDKLHYILGPGNWDEVSGSELEKMYAYLADNMTDDGVAMVEDRFEYKPNAISAADYDNFLSRLDRSIKHDANSQILFDDVIEMEHLDDFTEQYQSLNEEAIAQGFDDMVELSDSVFSYYRHLVNKAEQGGSNSVCATISLQIKQTITMTRQAFRGTLTVYNGHPTTAMEDVRLNLEVRDATGLLSTAHEFEIDAETLNGFNGEKSLSAGWTLAGDATGTATILFIPTKYAAPEEPQNYSFGGTLTYLDPFTGYEVTRTLTPVTLTVKPSPELDLTYFMQRDIYGDDPLSEDIESTIPAEFALLINNKGFGDATQVQMITNQPEIKDNSKGLLIDFEIVSSQVNGLDDAMQILKQGVKNDFGTIPAHSQLYAQWWLTSSLLGHFTDYNVEATHITSYGNEDLSLLDQVTIHELIHGFDMPAGSMNGGPEIGRAFLVNDIADDYDMPDMLYFTNGETASVLLGSTAQIVRKSSTEYELTITPSAVGWNYGSVLDPTHGYAELKSIVRKSDGMELGNSRFWQTDRTLRDGKDWLYENRLHFVDDFASGGTQTYVLTFEPTPETVLEVSCIDGIPAENELAEEPVDIVTVNFSKVIDPETFTADDITMNVQAEKQDASLIGITTEDNKSFHLDLSTINSQSPNGYYTLAVQTSEITDTEGFNGKTGKQVGWIMFRGGLVHLLTSVYPLESGSIQRIYKSEAKARRAPAVNSDNSARYGSTVTFKATPAEGYEFTNWTLNGDIVSNEPTYSAQAISDLNIVANFKKKNYLASINSSEGGSINGSGTGYYEFQTKLTLTAEPDEGYKFDGWEVDGELVSTNAQYTFTFTKATEVKALFSALYIIGDANGDGIVNLTDAAWIVRAFVGRKPAGFVDKAADVNGDGSINLSDARKVVGLFVGK